MNRVAVLNVVALSPNLIGEHTPAIRALAERAGGVRTMTTPLPAVTTTVQTSMLTGAPVAEHGIVANGWYDRAENEVKFWKQSNRLVQAEPVWKTARTRDPAFTCANTCWWYAMNSDVDTIVTPRPIYRANGRKIPDCWTRPGDLRDQLQGRHGRFPLFKFWGPGANIESTRWIASAALDVEARFKPTLHLVYLPHLDYGLQKLGPDHPGIPQYLREVDAEVARLLESFDSAGIRTILLSEYGVVGVRRAIAPNRELRNAGFLGIREELAREMLEPGESDAFAVADHQLAHVYVRNPDRLDEVASLLREVDGVAEVMTPDAIEAAGLAHERSGDLLLVSDSDSWFCYDWWLDPARAPDYATTVDIHHKPGYDPRELFMTSKARAAWKLMLMKLGFRTLLDVIPLDTSLVRGSHGRNDHPPGFEPVLIAEEALERGSMRCEDVRDLILQSIFGSAS